MPESSLYQKALKWLAARPRSEEELRRKLSENAPADQVERILGQLREAGYVDDANFSYHFASYRVRNKHWGRVRARWDLKRRLLNEEVVEQALDRVYTEVGEADLAELALRKRLRGAPLPKETKALKRLHDYLRRQGFTNEFILTLFERTR